MPYFTSKHRTHIDVDIKVYFGRCSYSFEKDSDGDYVHIYNLYVLPEFRRQGKAKELLQTAINAIRRSGWVGPIKIVAKPVEDSKNCISQEKLMQFYESMGLEVFTYYG